MGTSYVANLTPELRDSLKHGAMLSRDREYALVRAWQQDGDERALRELVSSHTRLVGAMIRRIRSPQLSPQDLFQEGLIGLVEAANRFDPERGFRFSTYALFWIKAKTREHVLRNWSIVRLPLDTSVAGLRASEAVSPAATGEQAGASGPGQAESDAAPGVTAGLAPLPLHSEAGAGGDAGAALADRIMARRAGTQPRRRAPRTDLSLNASVGADSDTSYMDTLVADDDVEGTVIASVDGSRLTAAVRSALSTLPPRERTILAGRLFQDPPVPLTVIAEQFGVTRERVRQLEARGLKLLRERLSPEFASGRGAPGQLLAPRPHHPA